MFVPLILYHYAFRLNVCEKSSAPSIQLFHRLYLYHDMRLLPAGNISSRRVMFCCDGECEEAEKFSFLTSPRQLCVFCIYNKTKLYNGHKCRDTHSVNELGEWLVSASSPIKHELRNAESTSIGPQSRCKYMRHCKALQL